MNNYFNSIRDYNQHYSKWMRNKETVLVTNIFDRFLLKQTTLEVGCGNGYYSRMIEKITSYNSFHLDNCLELLKKVIGRRICADFLSHPIKDNSFKQIVCLGAIEFIGKDFFHIANKLLVDNGVCLICMPKYNFYGFFYHLFYKRKNIKLYFYNKKSRILIEKYFTVEYENDLLLNKYFVLKKK